MDACDKVLVDGFFLGRGRAATAASLALESTERSSAVRRVCAEPSLSQIATWLTSTNGTEDCADHEISSNEQSKGGSGK